ncbi:hypothetical protein TVAG_070750 [Trichomonas vaginalis G3]|uniref:Uncharacterized protein n=1 Tax=Trichomonas vaginalis (strain ATCC PRA-98 / G3) TaxID=412133 RepID=A2D7X9_TRIV3|nr:hypothetical protein TVAGG3_1045330 [Trichomonas vaginalis G3]EAY23412.1 hypothetical protein TVAG_070750 [Trichomonas vaginalis G3]KAI5493825.1 hypothetical protein TVAGG3_1045330 [Trichomonas vaginalis G3]|eukprot:XP_001584398.1 hypothetical protein [Trichomonas vaginalis G3]
MTSAETKKRDNWYSFTKKMIEAYNVILMQIPSGALRDQLKTDHQSDFNYTMDNFTQTTKTNLINMLSQFLYYENSMSYIPTNDTLSDRVRVNIDSAAELSTKSILDVYDTNTDLSKKLSLVSYIFYAVAWALELFVAIPCFVAIMNGLKEELKYLFSLYLTMARSTISKFIDGTANTRRTDHRSISVLLTSTVMGHTRSTTDLSQDETGEDKIMNVADTFKVLVNDSGDQSSVLPPKFTTKALMIFTSFTFMPLIIATVNFLIMDFQVKELNRCMYTMQVISERTLKASLILYH